ncbi:hypothetical protein [Blastococcus jejuensis]
MWTAYGHDGDDPEEFHRRMSAPENEIPVALPQNVVLGRTDDAVIALQRLSVYTTGIAFDLVVRLRPDAARADGRDLNELIWHGGPGGGRFLLGVEFADGRRASNASGRHGPGEGEDVVFVSGGGSGGQASVEQSWWLHPLPPDGPLRIVVRCPDLGISERSVVLDGAAIRAAVDDVVVLWPWAPPPEMDQREPPAPPDLPADSWFAGS